MLNTLSEVHKNQNGRPTALLTPAEQQKEQPHGHLKEQDVSEHTDAFSAKINAVWNRIEDAKEEDLYYYFQPVDEIDGAWVWTQGQRKLMFATYSYLGLLKHPRIIAAAQAAVEKYGAGTHGVRILGYFRQVEPCQYCGWLSVGAGRIQTLSPQ